MISNAASPQDQELKDKGKGEEKGNKQVRRQYTSENSKILGPRKSSRADASSRTPSPKTPALKTKRTPSTKSNTKAKGADGAEPELLGESRVEENRTSRSGREDAPGVLEKEEDGQHDEDQKEEVPDFSAENETKMIVVGSDVVIPAAPL